MAPESKSPKPYRTYRGGRAGGSDDADAARFDFTGRSAAAAAPARAPTPEGMPAARHAAAAAERSPGGKVATPTAARRPGHRPRLLPPPVAPDPGRSPSPSSCCCSCSGSTWATGRSPTRSRGRTSASTSGRRPRSPPPGTSCATLRSASCMGSDSRGKSATLGARADSILLVRTDPGQAPHLDALDPARPVRPDPGPRREQDQRRVRVRRAAASDPHGEPAHRPQGEPRRDRRLHRLQGPDRRPRAGSPS